jgi:hypothetical protein
VPDDLRTLLELYWRDAETGNGNPLKSAGVTLLDADRMPDAVAAILVAGITWRTQGALLTRKR